MDYNGIVIKSYGMPIIIEGDTIITGNLRANNIDSSYENTIGLSVRLDILEEQIKEMKYKIEVETLKADEIILIKDDKEVIVNKDDFDKFIEQHSKNKFKELMD